MPDRPEPASASDHLTALAFDFGTRQIGTAVGQTVTNSARPLDVLPARDGQPDWQQVGRLLAEWQPQLILVGLPLNMDGSESEFAARARKFARRIQGRFGCKVIMMDERLSTREAKSLAGPRKAGPRESYRANPVDALSAALILESWLAEPQRGVEP